MIKRICFTLCCLAVNCCILHSQSITFNKTYDHYVDGMFNVIELSNGYYSAMSAFIFATAIKTIIVKTDLNGDTIFQKVFGDSAYSTVPYSFIKTSDGNFMVGTYASNGYTQTIHLFLLKIDLNGDSLWRKNIYAPSGYFYYGQYLRETSDKGFIIVGQFCDTMLPNPLDCDIMVLKTDSLGNEQWHSKIGGSMFDLASSAVETPDKGFLCLGWTRSFGFGSMSNRDVYLVKVDSLGNFQWQQTYGTTNHETGVGITETQDGNFLLCGGDFDFGIPVLYNFIRKIDVNGNTIWYKTYGNGIYDQEGWWARETQNNNIVAVGSRARSNGVDDGYVWLADSSGNMLWERAYRKHNDYSYFRDVQPTSDSGFICAGFVFTGDSGNQDGWLVKLDSAGCLANNCGVLTTDVQEMVILQKHKDVFIYPNPVHELIFMKYNFSQDDYFTVTIFNSIGQQVLQKGFLNSVSSTFPISVKELVNGLYFVRVGNEKHWETIKIIKE